MAGFKFTLPANKTKPADPTPVEAKAKDSVDQVEAALAAEVSSRVLLDNTEEKSTPEDKEKIKSAFSFSLRQTKEEPVNPASTLAAEIAKLKEAAKTPEVDRVFQPDNSYGGIPTSVESLRSKLADIESLMEREDLPVAAMKVALKSTLTFIKANEDSMLELEPEEIHKITRGYMVTADAEVVASLRKNEKKPAKKTAKKAVLNKLAEGGAQLDLGDMAF